jgi:hypothetical protein
MNPQMDPIVVNLPARSGFGGARREFDVQHPAPEAASTIGIVGGELDQRGSRHGPEYRRSGWGAWYRFGTDRYVVWVQIVHECSGNGRSGRSWKQRHLNPLGWGPKGRWFKSNRPDQR